MGAAPRYIGVPGEEKLLGHGVSACATCDGFFFRDHDIVVVGGGDSAMEEATFLTRFARSVTIVHRREEFRASGIMLERAKADEKISFRTNTVVTEVLGDNAVSGVRVRDVVTGEEDTLEVTGLFVAIGHDPRSTLVADQVETDDEGYVRVDTPSTYTNLPGVFACGDLIDKTYQQAVTAAGSGCTASIDAERWLAEHAATTPRDVPEADRGRRDRPPSSTPSRSDRPHRPTPDGVPAPTPIHPIEHPARPMIFRRIPDGQPRHRHRLHLLRRGAEQRQARPRRLLGDLVRPLQDGRPGPRGDRRRSTATSSPSPSWTSTRTRRPPVTTRSCRSRR